MGIVTEAAEEISGATLPHDPTVRMRGWGKCTIGNIYGIGPVSDRPYWYALQVSTAGLHNANATVENVSLEPTVLTCGDAANDFGCGATRVIRLVPVLSDGWRKARSCCLEDRAGSQHRIEARKRPENPAGPRRSHLRGARRREGHEPAFGWTPQMRSWHRCQPTPDVHRRLV